MEMYLEKQYIISKCAFQSFLKTMGVLMLDLFKNNENINMLKHSFFINVFVGVFVSIFLSKGLTYLLMSFLALVQNEWWI